VHLSCVIGNFVEDFAFLMFLTCCYDLNDCLMALCLVVFKKNFTMCQHVLLVFCIFDKVFQNMYLIFSI